MQYRSASLFWFQVLIVAACSEAPSTDTDGTNAMATSTDSASGSAGLGDVPAAMPSMNSSGVPSAVEPNQTSLPNGSAGAGPPPPGSETSPSPPASTPQTGPATPNGDGGAPASGGAPGSAGAMGNPGGSGGDVGNGGSIGGTGGSGNSSGQGGMNTGEGQAGETAQGGAGVTPDFRPCPTDGTACRIMPFGDSITDGFGTDGAYRIELFHLALQAGKNITFVGSGSNGPSMVDGVAFPPQHEGHSGFTIEPAGGRSGISPLVSSVMPQFDPHIVLLMIGTNDAIDDYMMAQAPQRLGALIDSIYAELPDILIVVAQPVPSQDDALNGRLQSYNAAIPAVVQQRAQAGKHILMVDMYAPIASDANYKTTLLKDTWHPNDAGQAILGGVWFSAIGDLL